MLGEPELFTDGVESCGHLRETGGCRACAVPHLDDGNVPVGLGLEHLLLADLVITHAPIP